MEDRWIVITVENKSEPGVRRTLHVKESYLDNPLFTAKYILIKIETIVHPEYYPD